MVGQSTGTIHAEAPIYLKMIGFEQKPIRVDLIPEIMPKLHGISTFKRQLSPSFSVRYLEQLQTPISRGFPILLESFGRLETRPLPIQPIIPLFKAPGYPAGHQTTSCRFVWPKPSTTHHRLFDNRQMPIFSASCISSSRKSGWAMLISASARCQVDIPFTMILPYSVTSQWVMERGTVMTAPAGRVGLMRECTRPALSV